MIPFKEDINFLLTPIKYFRVSDEMSISTHPHWHNAIEILYVVQGNAVQQLGEHIMTISEGDYVIIWCNQFHSTYSEGKCVIDVVQINIQSFINDFWDRSLLSSLDLINFTDKINKKAYSISCTIDLLIKSSKNNEPTELLNTLSYFYKMCYEIINGVESLPIEMSKKHNDNEQKTAAIIFDYITINYSNKITISDAAKASGLSTVHFLRVFKKISGMTFKKYLNKYRVEKSIIYIQNGYNITEAAMKSGFDDINTYIRNFKKFKYYTPSVVKNINKNPYNIL